MNVRYKDAMKAEVRKNVLRLVGRGPISRIEISRRTGLSQSAITGIVNDLLTEGIIRETGKDAEYRSSGRKSILLDVNPEWGYIVGISIERDGFEVGLLRLDSTFVLDVVQLPYREPVDAALDTLAETAERLISESGIPRENVVAVSAVAPGPLDSESGCILNPSEFEAWCYVNLREELARRLPYTIFVRHNSTALTLAESRLGEGKQFRNFALYTVSAGIGFGLVLHGSVYTGVKGLGCEIGHTSVNMEGRLCDCGNRGCLERYASTKALLYEVGYVRNDITSYADLVDKAYEGDAFCVQMLDTQAQYLAQSITNLNNMLELEAVFLSGTAAYRGELLLERIRRYVLRSALSKDRRTLIIRNSKLVKSAMVIAAGVVVIDQLFEAGLGTRRGNIASSGRKEGETPLSL